jgi:DNA-binding MarR family transcriptional regulator
MDEHREELIEKLSEEMIVAFRSLRPEHRHRGRFGHRLGGHIREHKFGRSQIDLFSRLMKEKEGASVKDIAESLHITSGAVSQLIDGAVKMGIVERQEDSKDRRAQRIKLTEKAASRVDEFRKTFFERLSPKFALLSDAEILELTRLLGKINQASEKEAARD